jgi:hypothetical protein
MKRYVSMVLAAIVFVGALSGTALRPTKASADDPSLSSVSSGESVTQSVYSHEALVLHYDMKTTEERDGQTIIKDLSGSEQPLDGIFRNPANGQLSHNAEVGFAGFIGGGASSNSAYIEIPKRASGLDALSGLNEVTVSALVNWENDGENRWIFGFGTVHSNIETGNKYFFATPRHGINNTTRPVASGISKSGWRNEALIQGPSTLQPGKWKLLSIVYSETADTNTIYVDGVKVASGSVRGTKLSEIIDPAASFSGFIGKSIFQNDAYLKGKVADFRVYNRAFTDQEAALLYSEASTQIPKLQQLTVDSARDSLNLVAYLDAADTRIDQITRNLSLPASLGNGVAVSWSSSNPAALTAGGVVTRPASGAADIQLELTAQLSHEGKTAVKVFPVKVLAEYTDGSVAQLDLSKLVIPNSGNIKGNIRLAEAGENGTVISWTSSHPDIVFGSSQAAGNSAHLGKVVRPAEDTLVTLTATATKGTASAQRAFELLVRKAPGTLQYDAYFFAYFTGEYEGGEDVSFATAQDPLKWRALNNGQSVLKSTLGEKGLRDPFIIRSPEGDKFYLLATDLKMGESTNFDQAQITGSHYMMIWESDDLVNWSEQRMVEVAPKNGGNTWAPEAFYDKGRGEYVVFWASSMKVADTYGKYPNGRPAGQYNVMYYATTRDFYTFSEPKVFIDEAFPTIDTTMLEHNGSLYRFTKSEVGYRLYYEKANDIFHDKDGIAANGYQFEPIAGTRSGNQGLIGHAGNNEGPTVFKDLHEEKWYMFLDSWPYHVRVSTNLDDGEQFKNNLLPESSYALPPGPRHGTVIPITTVEYNALQARYGVPGPAPSSSPVVHYTFDSDSVSGTTVKDLSGNGYDAQLKGSAVVNAADKVGGSGASLELDGATGYVELPPNIIKNLNLQKMTVSAWFKTNTDKANQRIFDFSSSTGRIVNRNTMYLSTQGDSGGLEYAIITPFTEKFGSESTPLGSGYKYALRASKPAAKEWHHVAVTVDGFDAVVYVDGTEVSRSQTFNVEPRMLLGTTMNYIGKSWRSSHPLFDGKIDEFRIYNRALTAEEIAALNSDVSPLQEKIVQAESAANTAKISATRWGHYTQASVDTLRAAIAAAKAVEDNEQSTPEERAAATEGLSSALATFRQSARATASIGDLAVVSSNYGSTTTDSHWSAISMYDLNQDGKIHLLDISAMAQLILQ